MKKLLYLIISLILLSCATPASRLEGIWVASYSRSSHSDYQKWISTGFLTIKKDSIKFNSFYNSNIEGNSTFNPYKASNETIWLSNSFTEKYNYYFKKDSLILELTDLTQQDSLIYHSYTTFFRLPKKLLKLNKLKGVYRWKTQYSSDTIEIISNNTILSNEESGSRHKTFYSFNQGDYYINLYNGEPTPIMLFPISGNEQDFVAKTNLDSKLYFHFTQLKNDYSQPNIIGNWELKSLEHHFDDFGKDTLITLKEKKDVEITEDSIFWGKRRYGYTWDYKKEILLSSVILTDENGEKVNEYPTFKVLKVSDNLLELERRLYGTIKYVFNKSHGREQHIR